MSRRWKEVRLGDVAEVSSSKRIYAKEYLQSGIPFYRSKEIIEKSRGNDVTTELFISKERFNELKNKFGIPNEGDILLTSVGTLGVPYIVRDEEFYFKDGNLTWIKNFKNNCYYKFLYYWLLSDYGKNQINSRCIGSTQKALTIDTLKKFDLKLPPFNEQKSIANILSTLDGKIEVNNQINKKLEEMAQTIFKHWFVDFEFPNENGEPYKSSGGEMVESELGMIPKGWRVDEIGNISEIQNGFAFKAPEYVDEGIKVLRTLNIGGDGYFENKDLVYLPLKYDDYKFSKYLFEKFDVALVMVGASIGKIGMILENTEGALQNQNMWRFRAKNEDISQLYLYYVIHEAQKISSNWATGSAREFYRKDSFSKIKVIIPNKDTLNSYDKTVLSIFNKISKITCENENLIQLRDTLLPKLMSGELRVPLEEGDIS